MPSVQFWGEYMRSMNSSCDNKFRWGKVRSAVATVVALGCFIAASPIAHAQVTSATILGTVTDPSGASVANATVTAVNVSTSISYSAKTNSSGEYLIPSVPIAGSYTVKVDAPGFQGFVRTGIMLQVNQNARVDAGLKIGAANETVQVSGETPLVDTHGSSLETVVEQERVTELPLNGRNPVQLAATVAGVTTINAPQYMTNRGGTSLSVNGARENENDYLVDGAHYEDSVFSTGKNLPNPDALQEFNLITNTFSAEYGRSAGSIFNAVPKSGTNNVHGSAWDFLRNDAFDAKNYFLNFPGAKKSNLRQNQFGLTLGGPAIKNKWFWFGSYQGLRISSQLPPTSVITPTAQERMGFFTTPLKDPSTGAPITPNAQGLYFIDPSRFSTVATNVMNAVLPLPGADGFVHQVGASKVSNNQVVLKSDFHINSSNVLSGSFLLDQTATTNPFFNSGMLGWGGASTPTHTMLITVHDTHTFRSNLLNELRLSYFKTQDTISSIDQQKNLNQWGDSSYIQDPQVINQNPDFGVAGAFSLTTVGVLDFKENTFSRQGADTITWIHGAHSIKAGMEIISILQHTNASFLTNGNFSFDGSITGNPIADFLVGRPVVYQRDSPGSNENKNWEYSGFVQDDWRATRRLTLNLGLRYFVQTPWVLANPADPGATFIPGQQSSRYTTAPAGLVYPGDKGVPRGIYATDRNNLEPRLGLAWDPRGDGKTAIRISYGIFHDLINSIGVVGQEGANQPFVFGEALFAPPGGLDNTYQGFPNPWPYRAYLSTNPTFTLPASVSSTQPDLRNPLIQDWTVDFQRQVTNAFLIDAAYVGRNSVGLYENIEANPAIFIPGIDPATGQPNSTPGNVNSRRIYGSNFAGIRDAKSSGREHFNALELTGKYRLRHGLIFTAAYTYSKSIDTSSTYANGAESFYPNPLCLPCNIGPSDYNRTHVFRSSWVYQLPTPFSRAKIANQVLGGWEVSGIATVQSGAPYSIANGTSSSLNGLGLDRADLVGDPSLSNSRPRSQRIEEWFNTAAFAPAAIGTTGDSRRNFLVGPSYLDTDLALVKNFPLGERFGRLQFRSEFFNAFNRVNLGLPNSTLTSGAFGQISSAGDARIIQFSLKYSF
jgi:hypothetical protein